jgi:hypothetical protein
MTKTRVALCCLSGLFLAFCFKAEGKLIGYWPLDATSGTIATNLVAGGTNGVLIGSGVTWVNDAQRGQVLSFGAGATATNYVDAGILPTIGDATNFTWSFWAYSQQGANNNVILGNRFNANANTGSQWIKFTTSKFEFTTSPQLVLDYADIPSGQWIHHAVVKCGGDRSFTYYRNGVAVFKTNIVINTAITDRPFYMGGDKFAEWWQGRIDDVAIWTDALPTNAIAGLANGTLTPLTAPRYPTGTFDLADALGGGDGRLPGYGGFGDLSAAMGTYTAYPADSFVDGTFVPNTNDVAAVIDRAGHAYDFNAQNSSSINLPWRNGLNLDVDPSTNILANFNGDPTNHSLISAHSSKGITFNLDAVRTYTGLSIERFTATIGDSRPKVLGTISYFVFVDGVLVTNRLAVHDSEDFVTVTQVSKGRYLTIAITDANDNNVCDHGYLGDAFLTLVPYTPPVPSKGTCFKIF